MNSAGVPCTYHRTGETEPLTSYLITRFPWTKFSPKTQQNKQTTVFLVYDAPFGLVTALYLEIVDVDGNLYRWENLWLVFCLIPPIYYWFIIHINYSLQTLKAMYHY
jgi:hypothetical protein